MLVPFKRPVSLKRVFAIFLLLKCYRSDIILITTVGGGWV